MVGNWKYPVSDVDGQDVYAVFSIAREHSAGLDRNLGGTGFHDHTDFVALRLVNDLQVGKLGLR